MALLFAEGFEGYATFNSMFENFGDVSWGSYLTNSGVPAINSSIYRTMQVNASNSRSLYLGQSFASSTEVSMNLPDLNEVYIGFAIRLQTATTYTSILRLGDNNCRSEGICIGKNNTNQLTVSVPNSSGYPGNTILGTSTNSIPVNSWAYVECRIVRDSTVGSVEVKINDTTEINLSGINTSTNVGIGGYTSAYFWCWANAGSVYFDDIYVCDATGTKNNTFLGPISVYGLMPTGAASSTQMTPVGDTNNYQCVDDPTADDVTTYVESATSGDLDLYSFEDLPSGITNIPGVMLRLRGSAQVGSRSMLLKIKNGANTITSAAKSFIFGTWNYQYHIAENAPDGTDWTKTSVDACEAGQEVV